MVPTAVLLDFDGVIADAENYHVAAWQRVLARLGWELPDEVAARSAAIDDHRFLSEIFAEREIDEADVDGWVEKKRSLTLAMIRHSPRLHPGAAELVLSLAGRTRLAVVSSAPRENVEALLDEAGLVDGIELIVAGEDVDETDSRLLALSLLEVPPDKVVAVEGSPEGLAAALAAGARGVAVGHRHSFGDWVGEAPFVPNLEPTSRILAQLGFGDPNANTGDRETP